MNDEQRKYAAEISRRIYMATHHVSKVADIPDESHFAVLFNEALNYTDSYDARSSHDYMQYIKFDSEEALHDWILKNHLSKSFKVISVKPVTIEMKTTITVNE